MVTTFLTPKKKNIPLIIIMTVAKGEEVKMKKKRYRIEWEKKKINRGKRIRSTTLK